MISLRFIYLSLAVAQLCQVPAYAVDYYVAITGNDSNPGTFSEPFRTITRGASVLQPGDTVYVRAGVYEESFYNDIPAGTSWDAPVTIARFRRERVTIKPAAGAEYAFIFSSAASHYIVVDGFIIDAADVTYFGVVVTGPRPPGNDWAHHIRFENSEMKNAPGQGFLVAGNYNEFINLKVHDNGTTDFDHGLYIEGSYNLVEDCRVYRNAGWGVHIYNGYPDESANYNVVRNNKIYRNARVGARGPGIVLSSGAGNFAYNNLIWGNSGGIQIDYDAINSAVCNNTVYANNANPDSDFFGRIYIGAGSSNAVVRNNIVYQNSTAITDDGTGTVLTNNLTTDPSFINPARANFHPKPSSAAIDAGVTIAEVPEDFDGVSRPQGAAYDIGAYEYVAPSSYPAAPRYAP